MSGLLVSVRNAQEAQAALTGGADLIDVKEPAHGSLGAASPECWHEVVASVAQMRPVSVALGELVEGRSIDQMRHLPSGISLAKLGLAECGGRVGWQDEWRQWRELVPSSIQPVAVVYADEELARAPCAERIVELAEESDCAAVLVDTCCKTGGTLLDHWTTRRLTDHLKRVRDLGMRAVVAGSLDARAIERLPLELIDLVAVRGAACCGDRNGIVDADAVAQLVAQLTRLTPLAQPTSPAT